jgi:hypothetical protein
MKLHQASTHETRCLVRHRVVFSWVPFTVKTRCAAPDDPVPLVSPAAAPPRAVLVVVRAVTPVSVEPITDAVQPSFPTAAAASRRRVSGWTADKVPV